MRGPNQDTMGTVYLVGAGPGDPKLITCRGWELLHRADVVLHDALVGPELLAMVSPRAEVIDVGRRAGETRWLTQERINRMLVELADQHSVVVRLKGGDPLVFGRGAEEALVLAEAGVPFEIVPGVTAGTGALAYAGIPLTHRGVATTALFVTAHPHEGPAGDERWRHIAHTGGTLVVYMAGARIRVVTERLMRLGRSPDTPAALVESGTLPAQRVVRGTLRDLAGRAGDARGPALIVVGEVARLSESLAWVSPGPLAGRTVLIARARAQRSRIASSLRALGATVLEYPAIHSRPGPDVDAVASAVEALGGSNREALGARGVLLFTGAAAVEEALGALAHAGKDARSLAGLLLVGIGRETIAALRRAGLRCDLPLRSYLPIRVVAALRRRIGPLEGHPVVLLLDGQEESALADALAAAGARTHSLRLATRAVDGRGRQPLERVIAAGALDALVLPSSSAAEALVAAGLGVPPTVEMIAIGPATAATAERLGLPAARVAGPGGAQALVAELLGRFGNPGSEAPRRAAASSDH